MTVWVANYSGHPYDDAERFGEIKFLTRGYVPLGNLDRLLYEIVEIVSKTEENDWLLLSGLSIISCIAATAWMLRHSRVKLLHYDKKLDQYVPLEFSEDQIHKLYDVITARRAEDKWRQTHE